MEVLSWATVGGPLVVLVKLIRLTAHQSVVSMKGALIYSQADLLSTFVWLMGSVRHDLNNNRLATAAAATTRQGLHDNSHHDFAWRLLLGLQLRHDSCAAAAAAASHRRRHD